MSKSSLFKKKITDLFKVSIGGALAFGGINLYLENDKFYDNVVMPFFHKLDPETAHNLAVQAAKYKIIPETKLKDSKILELSVFGMKFRTPIGLAAGFDKNGVAVEGMSKMGFSFVEIGSVTPLPQPGNPKPRVFRLIDDKGVINSYGFNSEGHEVVYNNLSNVPKSERSTILGINLGKNKTSDDPIKDYVDGVHKFGSIADYLVINISSPNTPGLRDMQHEEQLKNLISAILKARNAIPEKEKPPLLLKIAPDLTQDDKIQIAQIILNPKYKIDGLIVSNTTITRPQSLLSSQEICNKPGGLSGQPVREISTHTIRQMALLTKGKIPIIGVGGISSGDDAYEKIRNGASLVQLYTALIYNGPKLVEKMTLRLEELLKNDGFSSVSEAVGVDLQD